MLTFNYSLIRYMPNIIRGEIINIGIVIYTPELDIRLLKSSTKLRMFDDSSSANDLRKLNESLAFVKSFSKSQDDFIKTLSCMTQSINISKPASFTLAHVNQYEAKVNNLFDTLVKPFSTRESVQKTSRLSVNLKRKFHLFDILATDVSQLNEHKVVPNYVLNESTGITADFLLKNGKYHLTEVIDYDVIDKKSKFKETTMKIMTFVEGEKTLGKDLASYFVYSASSKSEEEVAQQINLAEDYSTHIFNLASREDEAQYFQIIQDAVGHELPLIH